MRARVLFLLALPALAQTPPPDVDQALRTRVTEFFQDFIDGQFRKALDLVAEDTKDEYFSSAKAQIKTFKVDTVKYDDSLANAVVTLTVKQIMRVQFEEVPVDVPMTTDWKIENGKWMFYKKPKTGTAWLTPMGPSNVDVLKQNADGSLNIPKKLDQDTLLAAARQIFQQSSVDKDQVKLAAGKASSEKVVFHNGAQGSVSLDLSGAPKLPGFSVKLDKTTVNFGEDAAIEIAYTPPPDQDASAVPPPANLTLLVAPFNQAFQIRVTFEPPAKP